MMVMAGLSDRGLWRLFRRSPKTTAAVKLRTGIAAKH
jgi:hypothetical protein